MAAAKTKTTDADAPEDDETFSHTLVLSNGQTVQTNVPVATHHYDRKGVRRAVVRRLEN